MHEKSGGVSVQMSARLHVFLSFVPVVTQSRPQALLQLGEDLFFQQRHQSRDSHPGAEQGRQGWYPAHTAGLCVITRRDLILPCALGIGCCAVTAVSRAQVFLTNSSNVFLLEPCQDVAKLLENQVEVCKGVLSIYRHIIMEHSMNAQTWSVLRWACSIRHFDGFHRLIFIVLSLCACVLLQGAVAAGSPEGHRGSDEAAAGKPKKRWLC